MKRFRFRLDSVLRLRSHELNGQKRRLAAAQAVLSTGLQELADARLQARRASARLMDRAREGIRAGDFELAERARSRARQREQEAHAAVARARAEVEAARMRVTTARTRVRTLEILRERALRVHREQAARVEQNALDEMAGRLGQRTPGAALWSSRSQESGR